MSYENVTRTKLLVAFILIIISTSVIECTRESVEEKVIVSIKNPLNGAVYSEGDTVKFSGETILTEGGLAQFQKVTELSSEDLIWISDKNDTIGKGKSLFINNLSVNTHNIDLVVDDQFGNSGDRIEISIFPYDMSKMVPVPGTYGYPMGGTNYHLVSLTSFVISKFEVTYELWSEVKNWGDLNGYVFTNSGTMGSGGSSMNVLHPVTEVSWYDCIAWCNAYSEKEGLEPVYYTSPTQTVVYRNSSTGGNINNYCVKWSAYGYRLPTEAEWEYAARYINESSFSSGGEHSGYNLHPDANDCAWFGFNSGGQTHEVGELNPNSLGIYDMSGNVWEWCWDWYGSYPEVLQYNPLGPSSGDRRVMRGAGWITYLTWESCCTVCRYSMAPMINYNDYGFRVCGSGLSN